MKLLEVRNLACCYGTAEVLHGVYLDVGENEIVCLLGRNGAGKTTLLRAIMGLLIPTKGKIVFDGIDITSKPTHERVKMGLGYIPDYRGILQTLTCRENLELATVCNKTSIDLAFKYIPELKEHLHKKGRSLSGGEQKILALAKNLVLNPRLMVIDEVSSGIAPIFLARTTEIMREVRKEKSLLLVEENIDLALELADRLLIMSQGEIVFHGLPEEANDAIQKYLLLA